MGCIEINLAEEEFFKYLERTYWKDRRFIIEVGLDDELNVQYRLENARNYIITL